MTWASRGYSDSPSCSKRSTKAWWLKPAVRKRTRSGSAPVSLVRNAWVSRTEWHRPNTRVNGGALVHRPGQHGHRVAVAEQVGVRADLVHVPGQRQHHRDGAQAAEDPADAQRVADRLAHPVPGRDVEVGPGGGVPADLHLVDHVPGARQRLPPVQGRGHRRRGAGLLRYPAGQPLGVRQPLRADVVQRDVQLTAELRVAAQIGHHVPGELDASRSDERHRHHAR